MGADTVNLGLLYTKARLGWAVPNYMPESEVKTIADLAKPEVREKLDGTITGIEVEDLFQLAPLPNWCFQRDPQIVLGDGVVFSAMAYYLDVPRFYVYGLVAASLMPLMIRGSSRIR